MDRIDRSAPFELGFLFGVLVGEGHFGGDGRQPHVTLKLHVRHESMLRYIMSICAGGRLYGPYHHGDRTYFQLMYRGKALRDNLIPLLDELPWERIDCYSYARYATMKERYAKFLNPAVSADTAVALRGSPHGAENGAALPLA